MTRLSAALEAIGWSRRSLADRLDVPEPRVRRWASGSYPPPEPLLAWLERVAAFLRDNPPP